VNSVWLILSFSLHEVAGETSRDERKTPLFDWKVKLGNRAITCVRCDVISLHGTVSYEMAVMYENADNLTDERVDAHRSRETRAE
jgi:hypothetical protein